METIKTLELRDEGCFPDEERLRLVLDEGYAPYIELLALYDRLGLSHGWRYYQDGKAWLNKVQHKKKTVAWMSAWKGFMQVTVYVPEKHTDKVNGLDLPEELLNRFRTVKKVGRSTPFILELRTSAYLSFLEQVMKAKMCWK